MLTKLADLRGLGDYHNECNLRLASGEVMGVLNSFNGLHGSDPNLTFTQLGPSAAMTPIRNLVDEVSQTNV